MAFVPDMGDVVWIDFNPQVGHEQAGDRPAVVLTPADYNNRLGLALCCPVTSKSKGYPFEVPISGSSSSVALADQVKCLDWRKRGATWKSRVTDQEVARIKAKLRALIGM